MNNFSNQMQMGDFNNNNSNNPNNNNYPTPTQSQNQNQNQYNPGTSNNQLGNGNTNSNINMDTISLNPNDYNGTSLNDLSGDNKYEDNNSLIKSLTKEIINNLKENNIDIYDNLTSRKYDDSDSESSGKKKKKKKKHKKDRDNDLDFDFDHEPIKEELQDYVLDSNPIPASNGYLSWLFNSGFDYKDFLILFILYFILSQEMIKDFFAKYFNCLNPDDEGKINIQGVIIYGLILTIFFMLVKKFF
jgi:hypothetical protein